MKMIRQIICLLLCTATLVACSVSATAKPYGEQELYENEFVKQYCFNAIEYEYDELYYHQDKEGQNNWVLVFANNDVAPGICHAVFDDIIILWQPSYSPFELGLGVYDVKDDTFYGLNAAWDMDYKDLHKVFREQVLGNSELFQQSCVGLLGDVDRDRELTIMDATKVQRYLAELENSDDELDVVHSYQVYGPPIKCISDYDKDGDRTIMDATAIQRHLAGLDQEPIEAEA